MACDCPDVLNRSGNSINAENHIPVRVGAPLSTLNERATIMGSIPRVINFAGFTLINCGVAATQTSNGGIKNPALFFQNNSCSGSTYANSNSQLAVNCCA